MQALDDAADGLSLPRLPSAASASTRSRKAAISSISSISRPDALKSKPSSTMAKSLRGGYKTPDNGDTTGWSETRRLRSEDIASFHIELAECVETKTVTTTTTTKRSYPPLLVQPPRPLESLDSKQYPLARKPTPYEIASFSYEVDGETVHFREDRRPAEALQPSPFAGRSNMQPACQSQTISSIEDFESYEPARSSRSSSEEIRVSETGRTRTSKRHIAKPISPNSFHYQPDEPSKPSRGGSLKVGTYFHGTSLIGDSYAGSQDEQNSCEAPSPTYTTTQNSFPSAVATPPIAESDLEPFAPLPAPLLDTSSLRPTTSAASHGASLPSPGLSPTLGASNPLGQVLAQEAALQNALTGPLIGSSNPGISSISSINEDNGGVDLNVMLDSFDSMPAEMKTFMMYQFLRRCNKKTLHIIAGVVNPALKCDFLDSLPSELSLHILSFLDAGDLCKAAQVSKRWRSIIDTNESGWKELMARDCFVLPTGELERAISHGWGWQDPHGPDACEKDISGRPATTAEGGYSARLSKKRKKLDKVPDAPRKNIHKRRAVSDTRNRPRYVGSQFDSWAEEVDGPHASAMKAEIAVPAPNTGLASLRQLHLFKSLYRRRFMLKRSWMLKEAATPRHVAFPAHPRHVITCLQFDDDKIITGSDDAYIHVYDTETGKLRKRLVGHEGGVWALQYEGNVLVSGSTDRTVRVWDIEKGVCTQVFQGHTSTVRCLQIVMPVDTGIVSKGKHVFAPEYPIIITGSRDAQLKVWKLPVSGSRKNWLPLTASLNEAECPYYVRTLSGHTSSVRAIAAHQDTLVSGSYDNTVRVWKISTGENLHTLRGHIQKVYSVVLDHKRNRCISGSMDNTVRIWDLETGLVKHVLEGHSSLVGLLDLKDDRLVSAAADSTLRIWDPETGQCKNTLTAHTGAITCFQHDGQKVISGSDRTLKMWDVKTGLHSQDLLTDLSGVWQVKFDERRCVAAVQRDGFTFVEVLDFGASRDGVPAHERGKRIVLPASEYDRFQDEDDL